MSRNVRGLATTNSRLCEYCLQSISTGVGNTALGHKAALGVTTGSRNTAIGYNALYTCTTGQHNTAVGLDAMRRNDTGNENISIGTSAGAYIYGDDNIAVGHKSGPNGANTISNSIAIGHSAIPTTNNSVVLGNTGISMTLQVGNKTVDLDASGLGAATNVQATAASITTKALVPGNLGSVTVVGALGAGSITSGFGHIDIGSDNLTATGTISLGATSFNDNNITNVGDINCDSISIDAAATGLDIVFGGNTTLNKISLTDHLADALNITQGGNSYIKFVTTNSSEQIVFGKGSTFNGTTIADLGTVTTADINGGTIDGSTIATSDVTVGSGKTLNVSGGTLTTSAAQNVAIFQGCVSNIDVGAYDLRAQTITADGLTAGRLVFAGTAGVLSNDSDLTFSTDTLTATKIGAFTAAGAINFDSQNMTNVDIDSGTIDGATIGGVSAGAGTFTTLTATGVLTSKRVISADPGGDHTITTAELLGGFFRMAGAGGGGYTLTFPTATEIVGALTNPVVGTSFMFYIQNTATGGGEKLDIATGTTDITYHKLSGSSLDIPENHGRFYLIEVTDVDSPAVTINQMGKVDLR